MTTKADFPEADWARVVRAPFVAGMAITLADPGGPIEAAKESMASIKAATNPPSREQLLSEVALDIQAQVQQHHNPVKGFRPTTGTPAGEQVLQELSDVCAIVKAHATPEEAAAFGSGWSAPPRPRPTPPRRAGSWASGPSWSASARRR